MYVFIQNLLIEISPLVILPFLYPIIGLNPFDLIIENYALLLKITLACFRIDDAFFSFNSA
jgi:hypothetical protein